MLCLPNGKKSGINTAARSSGVKARINCRTRKCAMRNAESKIEPVLVPFRDQVLFLKHNLNARAITSLQNELVSIQSDVSLLIQEMEKSINEANTFIDSLDG